MKKWVKMNKQQSSEISKLMSSIVLQAEGLKESFGSFYANKKSKAPIQNVVENIQNNLQKLNTQSIYDEKNINILDKIENVESSVLLLKSDRQESLVSDIPSEKEEFPYVENSKSGIINSKTLQENVEKEAGQSSTAVPVVQKIDEIHKSIQNIIFLEKEKEDRDLLQNNETYVIEGEAIESDFVNIFFEEFNELSPRISKNIRELKDNNTSNIDELKRDIHTIKGNVRMIGAMAIGEGFHDLETKMEDLELEAQGGKEDFEKDAVEVENKYYELVSSIEDIKNFNIKSSNEANLINKAQKSAENRKIKVGSHILDHIISESNEVRLSLTNVFESNNLILQKADDFSECTNRLTKMIRELDMHAEAQMQSRKIQMEEAGIEFDALEFDHFDRYQELTRFIMEGLGDLLDLQQDFLKNLSEQESFLYMQERSVDEVQKNLYLTRLVTFNNFEDRFHKIVNSISSELNKKVELNIEDKNTEVDRTLLEKLIPSIEHIIRNSIAHGIETPEERRGKNKTEEGNIIININQSKGRVVLSIADDGAGINADKVYKKALDKGIIQEDVALSHQQTVELILSPGFSTADEISQVAGRGVGMDVVKSEITSLGGRLDIFTEKDKGMRVVIDLPASISAIPALLVDSANQVWAFPVKNIVEVISLTDIKMQEAYDKGLEYDGDNITLHYFPHVAGFYNLNVEVKNYNHVIIFDENGIKTAFHVNGMIGTREMQLKPLDRSFSRISGIQGASIMPNGTVSYIVEPNRLLNNQIVFQKPENIETIKKIHIMVVDDSLTIRKTTSKLLEREDYEVSTAKNGEDALNQIHENTPDLFLLDVEMPKMDGFEFAKQVKGEEKYKNIPIIMITSRTAEKHKNHAKNLGVEEYLGKPYKEKEILSLIHKYTSLNN